MFCNFKPVCKCIYIEEREIQNVWWVSPSKQRCMCVRVKIDFYLQRKSIYWLDFFAWLHLQYVPNIGAFREFTIKKNHTYKMLYSNINMQMTFAWLCANKLFNIGDARIQNTPSIEWHTKHITSTDRLANQVWMVLWITMIKMNIYIYNKSIKIRS